MPEGLNEQMEFMERIKSMDQDERTLEIARLVYYLTVKLDCKDDLSRKAVATISGFTTAVVIGVVEAVKLLLGS